MENAKRVQMLAWVAGALLGGMAAGLISGASAASLEVQPGMWEFTSKVTNPMVSRPTIETNRECLKEDHIDPVEMMKTDECTVTDESQTGNSMTFQLRCDMGDGMVMTGSGNYAFEGSAMTGTMTLKAEGMPSAPGVNMPGTMTITNEYSGKRLGPC